MGSTVTNTHINTHCVCPMLKNLYIVNVTCLKAKQIKLVKSPDLPANLTCKKRLMHTVSNNLSQAHRQSHTLTSLQQALMVEGISTWSQ